MKRNLNGLYLLVKSYLERSGGHHSFISFLFSFFISPWNFIIAFLKICPKNLYCASLNWSLQTFGFDESNDGLGALPYDFPTVQEAPGGQPTTDLSGTVRENLEFGDNGEVTGAGRGHMRIVKSRVMIHIHSQVNSSSQCAGNCIWNQNIIDGHRGYTAKYAKEIKYAVYYYADRFEKWDCILTCAKMHIMEK